MGTSWSYMMYMVRGNRGGAETDGRAEDPFEAAARGASASVPWKKFLLLLYLHILVFSLFHPLYPPRKVSARAVGLRSYGYAIRPSAERMLKRAPSILLDPGATVSNTLRLNHSIAPRVEEKKIFHVASGRKWTCNRLSRFVRIPFVSVSHAVCIQFSC